MGTPDLRVDEGALGWDPADVTVPVMPAVAAGPDPLSTMVSAVMPTVATEVTEKVGLTRAREERFAANLSSARSAYQGTDGAEQGRFEAAEREFTGGQNRSSRGSSSLGAGSPAGAAGLGQLGGQFGQLVSMALQGGQQALAFPAQLAGMAGQVPQAVMQGVQGIAQQSGQSAPKSVDASAEVAPGAADAANLAGEQDTPGRDLAAENEAPDRDGEKQKAMDPDDGATGGGQRGPVENTTPQSSLDTGRHRRVTETSPEVAL